MSAAVAFQWWVFGWQSGLLFVNALEGNLVGVLVNVIFGSIALAAALMLSKLERWS
jgi:hypothetical protein